MTKYGEVIDIDGDLDTSKKLGDLLAALVSKYPLPTKRSKVNVLVSHVIGSDNNPRRKSLSLIYTFGYLLREWILWKKEPFNSSNFKQKIRDVHSSQMESYRKQGEKATAWATFNFLMRMQNIDQNE